MRACFPCRLIPFAADTLVIGFFFGSVKLEEESMKRRLLLEWLVIMNIMWITVERGFPREPVQVTSPDGNISLSFELKAEAIVSHLPYCFKRLVHSLRR